jgi:putative membrane protein (TIGR04086 family)
MLKTSNQMSKPAVNESMSLVAVLKGILAAYIITIPAFMLFALILANTDYSQKLITPAVVITTIISVLTAGSISTRGLKNKGWLNGSIVGFLYMLILYLSSSLIYRNFVIDKYVVTMVVIGILTGAIGGIIGINIKKSTKYKHAGI